MVDLLLYGVRALKECICTKRNTFIDLLGCKPTSTPMVLGKNVFDETNNLLSDSIHYRRVIGKLLYLSLTRPDITFHASSSISLWGLQEIAIGMQQYIFSNIKGTHSTGLFYAFQSPLTLNAYCDPGWGTCPLTRCSVTDN